MIVLEPGFKCNSKEWPQYVNMTKIQVEELLKKEMPNVQIKVFGEEEFQYCSEEFYFEAVALVLNESEVVVCAPKYFGKEPDFGKIPSLVGKDHQDACKEISVHIPSARVIVKDKDDKQVWSNKDENDHYILVRVDAQGKVCEPLSYIRVAK